MSTYSSPGEEHTAFMQWAIAQGVNVNGVEPARIPGRGLGMIATRDIQEDEIMVNVPLSAMLSIDSIPAAFVDLFNGEIPLQGLLAAFLIHGDPTLLKKYDLWKATWPTIGDFEDGMPILWPKELGGSNLRHNPPNETADSVKSNNNNSADHNNHTSTTITLPPSASGLWNTFRKKPLVEDYETKYQDLLTRQEKRLWDSWRGVIAVFPDTNWEIFSYYWLIVNTRSFYYLMPGEERPVDTNEAMAMVPFADYFNHVDDAECDVNFDGKTYTFRATKVYKKGEEVYMSYGPHPNDFLFIEYGFYLSENESDALYLDDIIFKDFTVAEKEELIFQRYHGNYQITLESGPCFRTEVAASMKCMSRRNWRNYIQGRGGTAPNAAKVNAIIRDWIETYLKESRAVIDTLEAEMRSKEKGDSLRSKIQILLGRWEQIKRLCDGVVLKLD